MSPIERMKQYAFPVATKGANGLVAVRKDDLRTLIAAVESLKPFASVGAAFSEGPFAEALWADSMRVTLSDMRSNGSPVTLSLGDFRKANAMLVAATGEQG